MQKIFIILLLLTTETLTAQYTFRGRVTKDLTGKPIAFGYVHVPTSASREQRIGKTITELDPKGYFTISIKDSADVRITVDCFQEGMATKTVSYTDTVIHFIVHTVCTDFNEKKANRDIKEDNVSLIYNGTIYDTLTRTDLTFQKTYNIKYYDFTDAPPWSDCIREYNRIIATYLDKKFGRIWRNEVMRIIQFD